MVPVTQASLLHELSYPIGLFCRTADRSACLVVLELELLAGGAMRVELIWVNL